jgi:hypothetical protein
LPDKTLTPFDGALVTIRSKKSYADVTAGIEAKLQRFSIAKFMEYVVHRDKEGLEAYVARVSAPSKFSIFWDFEQGSSFRLAGIPIESEFYLVGNAVIARGLFPAHQDWEHRLGSACPSATVRKPHRHGSALGLFSKFPETRESDVPALLTEMVKVFKDAAA